MASDTAALQTPMPSDTAAFQNPVPLSRYSKRVFLKTILGREDGGIGLVGEKVVVGGWVKSSAEVRKEPVAAPPPAVTASPPKHQVVKDVSCVEILQTRIPLFRSIMKVLGGGGGNLYPIREKVESLVKPPPPPSVAILHISDGSCVASLKVLVDSSIVPPSQVLPTGTCIVALGILQQPAVLGKHPIELKVEKILHIGTVDQGQYPLSKKRLPLDMLRDFSHFRPRTTTVASVTRIRSSLTQGAHSFFMNNGFLYVQLPIITTTNGEGSSEKFYVTTLLGKEIRKEVSTMDDASGISLDTVKASIKEKSKQVEELKRTESNREALAAALVDLRKTNELVSQLEAREKQNKPKTSVKSEKVDFSKDYFSRPAYLTVSGRLHLESYARALGNVYSFGPRFQAHKADSKRHVAEMWMVEVEMAFSRLEDAMECTGDFLKYVGNWALEKCLDDLKFLSKRVDKTIVDRIQQLTSTPIKSISYAEALEALKQVTEKKFEGNIGWGVSLTEEHESWLTEEIYKSPIIIHTYPKELKPFYVRLNDDGKTVAAFDLVVPKMGTLLRGSQNEERLKVLTTRIKDLSLPKEQYEWYLDLRRQGTVGSSGFSLNFDLLVAYATGLADVKDVIPFPRSRGRANN